MGDGSKSAFCAVAETDGRFEMTFFNDRIMALELIVDAGLCTQSGFR
jgi:hypothetical protein